MFIIRSRIKSSKSIWSQNGDMNLSAIFILGLFALIDVIQAYQIGVGRADVTGPIVEITLMGYGKFDQKGTGIHTRQWSRAFIINDGKNRFAFVNVDVGMMADGVRIQAIKNLEKKFKGVYNMDNVMISGTHTHSGVGGFMMHTFFDIPSGGFCNETFDALVSGIVKSVERAHENLQEGKIVLATQTVFNVSVNRSPSSYLKNPKEERDQYQHDTDKEMVQLKFVAKNGEYIGAINWYPIHGTTLNYTNKLVSSDNIGYASIALEKYMEWDSLVGKSKFVGAFASSNLGDVSPNVGLPKCHRSNTECDIYSKCEDMFEECYALGPESDMYDSVQKIGFELFMQAWAALRNKPGVEITGPVQSIHQYVDMATAKTEIFNKTSKTNVTVRGCPPAMGYSAGAGTTDGAFLPFLKQGMKNSTWWIDALTHILGRPTDEEMACHAPKPILLASSHIDFPFEWQPRIVSTQLARIGNVVIACVPGEFTTMAGRRMKKALAEVFGKDAKVIIAGLCNTYSDYITTFEEYQDQRYEAASTLYGPHTLSLHLAQYKKLGKALKDNTKLERGPEPKGLDRNKMLSLIPPVTFDAPKKSHKFGDVLSQPGQNFILTKENDTVRATFVAGNPRNNLRLDDTFFLIEMSNSSGNWTPVASDADIETRMIWRRTDPSEGTSEVDIEWRPKIFESNQTYRIRHFGSYKTEKGEIKPYQGQTKPFKLSWKGSTARKSLPKHTLLTSTTRTLTT